MECRIKQEFIGTINGVEIKDKQIFYHVSWILDLIEEEFNLQQIKPNFIRVYASEFENFINDLDEVLLSEIEQELESCVYVDEATNIKFVCFGRHLQLSNQMIKEGQAFV